MPRAYVPQELGILTFFEEAPIEKAELLFNIVKEKMRGRLAESRQSGESKKKRHAAPKETGLTRPENEGGESSPQV